MGIPAKREEFYALVPCKVVTYAGKVEHVVSPSFQQVTASLHKLNRFRLDSSAIQWLKAMADIEDAYSRPPPW